MFGICPKPSWLVRRRVHHISELTWAGQDVPANYAYRQIAFFVNFEEKRLSTVPLLDLCEIEGVLTLTRKSAHPCWSPVQPSWHRVSLTREGPRSLAGWGRALRLPSPRVKVVRGMRQAGGGAPQYHQCERPSTHAFVSLVLSPRIRNLFMVFKSCVFMCDTGVCLVSQFTFFILKASSKFLCKGGGCDTFRAFLTHEGK